MAVLDSSDFSVTGCCFAHMLQGDTGEEADAVYEHTLTPTAFFKSRIAFNFNTLLWELTRQDGTVFGFPDGGGVSNPGQAALRAVTNRTGQKLTFTRAGNGNLTTITSSSGRRLTLAYDGSNRVTSATDHTGRAVGYTYNGQGYLWKVTDPEGGVTEYTYDGNGRMSTLKDARGLVFLTNEYDFEDRVIRQIQADNSEYLFAYTEDGGGAVIQTDVTGPRGFVRQVTFNAKGYILTDTRAVGETEEQMVLLTRQSGTNLPLSLNDPLGRETTWTYDSLGNVLSETRLAGTGGAVTTTFSYEPNFQQVASVTDPLQHTTTITYDSLGNPVTITDPLQHQTSMTYNSESQLLSLTDGESHHTQFTYESTDLVGV
ncbi:MAG: RHS repeat protein, partial [Nitrospira sp.]|nr:RHS repeat protein [Nitrospira sp.]